MDAVRGRQTHLERLVCYLNDEGCYETGYLADVWTRTNRVQYDNAIDACAAFIKQEIEDIRSGK